MPSFLEYESLKNRLIVLEGWSKTYCMTGWRLGWSIWPNNLIEHANKICVNYNSCATSISQYAGLEAIKGSQKELLKIVNEFETTKGFLKQDVIKPLSNQYFTTSTSMFASVCNTSAFHYVISSRFTVI